MTKSVLIRSFERVCILNWENTPAATLISHLWACPRASTISSPSPTLETCPVTIGDVIHSHVAKKCGCFGSATRGENQRAPFCASRGGASRTAPARRSAAARRHFIVPKLTSARFLLRTLPPFDHLLHASSRLRAEEAQNEVE